MQKMGIPCIELEGYEADDVIGTMANKAAKENYKTATVAGIAANTNSRQ
jgi:5'-3' exonuclease